MIGQRAMEIGKIGDLEPIHSPSGMTWWEVDGVRYEWRQGAPYLRITCGAEVPTIVPLDAPTKAAAKRAVFQDIKRL